MYTHLKFVLAGSVTSSDSGHSTQTSGSTDACMTQGASPPPPLHLRRHSVLQPPGSFTPLNCMFVSFKLIIINII